MSIFARIKESFRLFWIFIRYSNEFEHLCEWSWGGNLNRIEELLQLGINPNDFLHVISRANNTFGGYPKLKSLLEKYGARY